MNAIPPELKAAIDRYLAENAAGSLVEKTSRMSERYRQGRGSDSALDFGAYLVARLPATYAAVTFCLAELARRRPQFSPRTLLDAGSGPGTTAWAATATYPGISTVTFLDNNLPFLKLASGLAAQGDHAALQEARAFNADVSNPPGEASADLVIAAYALAELPLPKQGKPLLRCGRPVKIPFSSLSPALRRASPEFMRCALPSWPKARIWLHPVPTRMPAPCSLPTGVIFPSGWRAAVSICMPSKPRCPSRTKNSVT